MRPWADAVAAAVAAKAYATAPQWERDQDVLETLSDVFGPEALAALDPDYDSGVDTVLFASPWGTEAERYDEAQEGFSYRAEWERDAVSWSLKRIEEKWGLPYGRPLSGRALQDAAEHALWMASEEGQSFCGKGACYAGY